MLDSIANDVKLLKPDIRLLFLLFQGYGKMVKHRFGEALDCYSRAAALETLDAAAAFNRLICEGVLQSQKRCHEQALEKFAAATKLFPNSKEGYVHRLMAHVGTYLSSQYSSPFRNFDSKQGALREAAEELGIALEKSKKDAELHFYSGLLEMVRRRYTDAIQEFGKVPSIAIERDRQSSTRTRAWRGTTFSAGSARAAQACSEKPWRTWTSH